MLDHLVISPEVTHSSSSSDTSVTSECEYVCSLAFLEAKTTRVPLAREAYTVLAFVPPYRTDIKELFKA